MFPRAMMSINRENGLSRHSRFAGDMGQFGPMAWRRAPGLRIDAGAAHFGDDDDLRLAGMCERRGATALSFDGARFREQMQAANRLIVPTDDDWNTAWGEFERGSAADAGIVDHISFAVMRRLGIDEVFTNDRHFNAAGFKVMLLGRLRLTAPARRDRRGIFSPVAPSAC